MKEFELTLRLRNNCLKRRRADLGMTCRELAEKTRVTQSLYSAYETMRASPLRKKRYTNSRSETSQEFVWKPSALRIAAFHGCSPNDLWPDVVLSVRQSEIAREVSADEVLALATYTSEHDALPPTPEELVIQKELNMQAEWAMEQAFVGDRTREILLLRAQGVGRPEIARDLGVSTTRINQVEKKAWERLTKFTRILNKPDREGLHQLRDDALLSARKQKEKGG